MTPRFALPLLALAGLAGCSLLFDPSKAPPRCPVDPPANPDSLVATVGATGVIEWSWPAVTPASSYKLCTTVPGGAEQCRTLDPAAVCSAAGCVVRDEGLVLGVRVSARVQAADECGLLSPTASAPTTSATPISTTSMEGWVLTNSCASTTANVVGGLISIDQSGFACSSTFLTGDELWGDFTIDADVRVSPLSGSGTGVGLAMHANATGHRLQAVAWPSGNGAMDPAQVFVREGTQERIVASSIHPLLDNGFTHFRITSSQGVVSWQLGTGDSPPEILRWPDTGAHAGRIGIAASGAGRVEVQNFVVRTPGTLPARGPSAFTLDFADGGYGATTRLGGVARLSVVPCPPWGDACGGTCAPAPGTSCARFERVGLGYTILGFDLPAGVDTRRAWDLQLRFATQPDAGSVLVLDSRQGILLYSGADTTTGLEVTYPLDGGLAAGAWHAAAWHFEPDAGRFGLTVDGQPATPATATFPPGSRDRFTGAFWMGNFLNTRELYGSDVHIGQTP